MRQRFVDSYLVRFRFTTDINYLHNNLMHLGRDEAVYDTQKNKVKVKKSFLT